MDEKQMQQFIQEFNVQGKTIETLESMINQLVRENALLKVSNETLKISLENLQKKYDEMGEDSIPEPKETRGEPEPDPDF